MFSPGETISHEFIIPFISTEISKIITTYKQNNRVVIIKTIASGFESYQTGPKTRYVIAFSQEESLLFDNDKDITIQINVFLTDGTRAASKEINSSIGKQHYRQVITNG